MHIIGMHGHPAADRRPDVYPFLQQRRRSSGMNQFMTYSAFVLGLTQIIFAYNFFYSLVAGPKAGDNPWHANTLEWATTSPPPHYNFETIPTVYHPAYEYSVPGRGRRLPAADRAPAGRGRPLDPVMA